MEIKKENLNSTKIKLNVHLKPEEMKVYFAKVYNRLAPHVEVKGFRKGMAPKHLTIATIGEARLIQEILDEAISQSYTEALKKEQIIPVAPPQVAIKMMKDLTTDQAELEYDAELDILPEVKLGDYKKIKIKKSTQKLEATKEDLAHVLEHLQRQHATFSDIDRAAKNGDRVEIDFEGSEKGVVLEALSSKNYPVILGTNVLQPDFEKKLIGMKLADEKEFEIPVGPEKKKIHFKVKMNDIKDVILPELDDEFAKKYEKKTIKDLEESIKEDVVKQKEVAQKQAEEAQVIEEVLKMTKFDVPHSLVDQEIHRMIDELKQRTAMVGLPFEKYLEQINKTEEDLHKDFTEQAEKTVKIGLILGEIGKAEKIDLSDKDAGKKVVEKLLSYAQK